MRLGQLARKLSVRPSQIVDVLAKEQLYFDDGSNAKLSDEVVKKLVLHFAPERLAELMIAQTQETEEPQNTPEPIIEAEKVEPDPEPVAAPKEVVADSETIRAPKVELAGLKVLGKIDLPEPRKKETAKAEADGENEPPRKREQKDKRRKPIERSEKKWRNPVAQQRESEIREREERRKQALDEEKERKRLHYLNKVKTTQPAKAIRIYEEDSEGAANPLPQQKPRTWLGRFLRWLNT
ncbi:MAG: hypothetical protein KF775_06345 [Cyclobacteriaceae bacterium]|nr:hypothetical protein [Cyclobacteriaceae bacterium]